ncbi:MAG: P-II family nitrogen regulator [Calditrichaceae bacterium]|nr:P-II family nitrogen regulator [Calditrichia bacterium]NUQ40648.1 P-II family nitrogen regulator [Calditrichaceae bacterium]
MKEIKAYIRCQKAEKVIEALEDIGITDITLIDVMGVGVLADPKHAKYSVKCVEKYSEVAKLEVVCSDERVHEIVEVIRKTAYTSMKGDGIIFVSPVELAVKIRTGAIGEEAL